MRIGGRDLELSVNDMDLNARASSLEDTAVARLELLRKMDTGLHELSQPMTALMCLLEYGASLEASDEMRQVMTWSTEAIERLRVTVIAMQATVQREGQRENR